jgi:hypothetical protein
MTHNTADSVSILDLEHTSENALTIGYLECPVEHKFLDVEQLHVAQEIAAATSKVGR